MNYTQQQKQANIIPHFTEVYTIPLGSPDLSKCLPLLSFAFQLPFPWEEQPNGQNLRIQLISMPFLLSSPPQCLKIKKSSSNIGQCRSIKQTYRVHLLFRPGYCNDSNISPFPNSAMPTLPPVTDSQHKQNMKDKKKHMTYATSFLSCIFHLHC